MSTAEQITNGINTLLNLGKPAADVVSELEAQAILLRAQAKSPGGPVSEAELTAAVERLGMARQATTPLSFALMARSGERAEYQVPIGTPIYRDRCLCRVGRWNISDGTVWTATRELFDDFAATYDPHWCVAIVNFDHDNQFGGPVQGVILNCRRVGDELRGDVAILDWYAASSIDAGQWPRVSIEWWEAAYMGEDFYAGDPKHKGVKNYLTGLAILGKHRGAAAGLGPWPKPEYYGVEPADETQPAQTPGLYTLPLAAASDSPRRALQIISEEVEPMANEPEAQTTNAGQQPLAAGSPSPDVLVLQQQNRELQARVAAVEAREAAGAINARVQNLMASGKINAAQLELLAPALDDARQRPPRRLEAADGSVSSDPVSLAEKFLQVLEAGQPQTELGAHGFTLEPPQSLAASNAFQKTLAAQAARLGLSEDDLKASQADLAARGKLEGVRS